VTRVHMAAEQRKWRRRSVRADGFLYASDGSAIGPCQVADVSVGGARLSHAIHDEIPIQLVLLLSRKGEVRRRCHVVWRSKHRVGVRFIESSLSQRTGG
jgi:PilZ domain